MPAFFIVSAWALFVLAWYFRDIGRVFPYVGEMFNPGSFPSPSLQQCSAVWGQSLVCLLCVLALSFLTVAWGSRLRRFIGFRPSDAWVRMAFNFGLGISFLGLFWMGTGLDRVWYRPIWVWGQGALLAIALWDGFRVWKERRPGTFNDLIPGDAFSRFLFGAGLFYCFFSLFLDLTPETFYDSMVYHLAVPNYWLIHHGIRDFSTNFFSNYPFGGELYFLNGLVWQGTEAAKMLHVVCFGACALLAGGWARELGGERAGWMALGLTLTFPLFAVNTWATQVEGLMTLAVALFAYTLFRGLREGNLSPRDAILAGLFAGLALSTKYTALLSMGSVLAVLAFGKSSFFKPSNWKAWIWFFLAAALLFGPWVVKNLLYTGNPIFPYLMSHFPGRHLPEAGYQRLLAEQHARSAHDPLSWLLLPWTLTMSNPDSYNFCGPIALALAPFLFLFRLRHPVLKKLAWLVPLFLVLGLSVTHILKFIVPDFVFLYVLLAAALWGGNRSDWGKGVSLVSALVAVLCFANVTAISHYYYPASGIWYGVQTRGEYLSNPGNITPYYPMAQWVNAQLPGDARLLVAGDARGLYYEREFLTNTVFDEQALAKMAREEKDPSGVARRVRELGVDHIVVNGLEGIRVSPDYGHYDLSTAEWEKLDGFIQTRTDLVYSRDFQAVYRVREQPKEKAAEEIPDLLMFFSKPASQYILQLRKHNWNEAKDDLNQALGLYSFSNFWKKQKADFDRNWGEMFHG